MIFLRHNDKYMYIRKASAKNLYYILLDGLSCGLNSALSVVYNANE
jgi:hypothetical protein